MTWMLSHPMISLCYGFLYLTVVLLWFPGKALVPRWVPSLLLALILGFISKQLQLAVLTPIILMAVASYYSQNTKVKSSIRLLAVTMVLIISLVLVTHQLPGFNNLLALDHVYLSTDAIPYTMYLNFDKALVGIFILGLGSSLLNNPKQVKVLLKKIAPRIGILLLVMVNLAFILGFIHFDPKLPGCTLLWILTNLLFTCVAEEALFRGFIQKKLALVMKENNLGNYSAIVVAALLFGLAHHTGGMKYMGLATVAGLGYGWIYHNTKRIEASILAHFSVNLTHFLLFTYPALASVV